MDDDKKDVTTTDGAEETTEAKEGATPVAPAEDAKEGEGETA